MLSWCPGGQFWSVYVPCETQNKDAVKRTLEQIDVVHRMCQLYPETFSCVVDSAGETGAVPGQAVPWDAPVPTLADATPSVLLQAFRRPSRKRRWPASWGWREATPSTAAWLSSGPSTTWVSAT